MPRNKLPRVTKHYSSTVRRYHGRFLKRLVDTWDRNRSTSDPTPWQICHNVDYDEAYTQSSSTSSVICQTTGPKPLPKRFLHIVRSRASSFNWQQPLLFLKSSSSSLRLLPRLLVTFICSFIFPSICCCRRQFLRMNSKNHIEQFLHKLGAVCYPQGAQYPL